jgi:hypothetical protein
MYSGAVMKLPSRRLLPTLRSMAIWIGGAVVLAVSGLLVVHHYVPFVVLDQSANAVGNYLQTLGTIYAVLLAFVVFVVWQQFNDARAHVETEANELLDLVRTVRGLPGEVRFPLLALAERYVQGVLGPEWVAMRRGEGQALEEGARVLDQMWDRLVEYEPRSECHKSLYEEALARFNDVSDRRSNRLSSSRLRIPVALRLLIYAGAAMTVGSLYLFAVRPFVVHVLMTAALAGAIGHLLYVISDLDDCFDGDWQVPRGPFERVRDYLAALHAGSPAA